MRVRHSRRARGARTPRLEPLEPRQLLSNSAPYFVADPTTERVASGLTQPTQAAFAPGDNARMFITELGGAGSNTSAQIKVVDLATQATLATPFVTISGITTVNSGQGLLGMAFHPDYAQNGKFYVLFTETGGGAINIREYTVSSDPNVADPASARTILKIFNNGNHNGGFLDFSPQDGYLYAAIGDGTSSGGNAGLPAQDLNDLRGKLIRIDVDADDYPADPLKNYAIPPDNPFASGGGKPEIFALGLRNAFRNGFDSVTGDLFLGDVGGNGWEEINYLPAGTAGGQNYGWRVREGSFDNPGNDDPPPASWIDPIYEYKRSPGQGTAVTGGLVYRGSALPQFQGLYFFADFITSKITSFSFDGTTVSELTDRTAQFDPPGALDIKNITSITADADGELYFADFTGGEVFKLKPASFAGTQSATTINEGGQVSLTLHFVDPDALDAHTLTLDWGDGHLETIPLPVGARSWSGSHPYVDDSTPGTPSDAFTIQVTLDDGQGGQSHTSTSVVVQNLPPTAVAGGPYVVLQGRELALDANASSDPAGATDPLSFSWDLNGDSVFDDALGAAPSLSWAALEALGITPSNSYAVEVRVTDDDGGHSIASTSLDVTPDVQAPRLTPDVTLSDQLGTKAPYVIPTGSGEQLRTVPLGLVDRVHLAFDEPVALGQGDLSLIGPQGAVAPVGFAYDPLSDTASWTFADALPAGQYTLSIPDSVVDLAGNPLDGEWDNPASLADASGATVSGDGLPGGAFQFVFTILPGDANRDNVVSGADYTLWADHFDNGVGPGLAAFAEGDFNDDGFVTGADYTIWAEHYQTDLRDFSESLAAPAPRRPTSTPGSASLVPPAPARARPSVADAAPWPGVDAVFAELGARPRSRRSAGDAPRPELGVVSSLPSV